MSEGLIGLLIAWHVCTRKVYGNNNAVNENTGCLNITSFASFISLNNVTWLGEGKNY